MEEKISRSEQKRRFKQTESAAKELAELGNLDLNRLPVGSQIKDEIILCRKTKGGARKRQIKYIAKLVQNEDLAEIYRFLQEKKGSKLEENQYQHEAERLRDTIVDDALLAYEECRKYQELWELNWQSPAIEYIVKRFPEIDENEIRRSAHQYARGRSKTHYRELFRIIKAAADKHRLTERRDRLDR